MGVGRDCRLMVQASLKAIGPVMGGAAAVVEALCEHLDGGLLAVPAYTFETVGRERMDYDPRTEPSCSGLLGEAVLCLAPGAERSLHPLYSAAVCGTDAHRFIEDELYAATPFPRRGFMGKLLDAGGKILLCGVGLEQCAMMYCAEEWCGIPGRLSPPRTLYIADNDGEMHMTSVSEFEFPDGVTSKNYRKMNRPLIDMGAARKCRFGNADCLLIDCAKLISITTNILLRMPEAFSDSAPIPKSVLKSVKLEEKDRSARPQ